MANEVIRPSELPLRSDPVASEVVPSDNGSTVAGVSWEDGVNAAVPPASQSESEAGVINSKRMTPLTTKQAIDAQVPPKISSAIAGLNLGSASQAQVGDFATAAQGVKADTALQPADIGDTVQAQGAFLDALSDMTPGSAGQVIAFDSNGDPVATYGGNGDMLGNVYDPQAIDADAFARENHTGPVVWPVADLAALEILNPATYPVAYMQGNTGGLFVWQAGDQTGPLSGADAADWIESDLGGFDATVGAWRRFSVPSIIPSAHPTPSSSRPPRPYINRLARDLIYVQPREDDDNRAELQAAADEIEYRQRYNSAMSNYQRGSGNVVHIGPGACPISAPVLATGYSGGGRARRGMVWQGSGRGTVIFPLPGFPANRALLQSRATADRGSSDHASILVRDLSLYGVDPRGASGSGNPEFDAGASGEVFGAWFTALEASGAHAVGFHNVFFRALKQHIVGSRNYGLHIDQCSFRGGESVHYGDAIQFDHTEQIEPDEPTATRSFSITRSQFTTLSRVGIFRYNHGMSFCQNRIENITPDSGLSFHLRAAIVMRQIEGASMHGNYYEGVDGDIHIVGGFSPGADDVVGLTNTGNFYMSGTGRLFQLRGLRNSQIDFNAIRERSQTDFSVPNIDTVSGCQLQHRNGILNSSNLATPSNMIRNWSADRG